MKAISKIQYITNGQSEIEILEEVQTSIDAGLDWVQLRVKNEDLNFLEIAKKVQNICAGKVTLIINDRVDIASELNCDGVHLGKEDMSISDARKILGNKIIGGTANTIVDCKNLEVNGADYIGLGPYRETRTKKKLSPILGLNGYLEILPKEEAYGWSLLSINTPIVAIGGIELEDVRELEKKTKIFGIAVSGMINKSNNKKELLSKLKDILKWEN